jgi:DNA-binding NarL/FixJ family response regulator
MNAPDRRGLSRDRSWKDPAARRVCQMMATFFRPDAVAREPSTVMSVVVVADDVITARRIAGAISRDGIFVMARGEIEDESLAACEDLHPDAVVFACDLAASARMTALRRVRKRMPKVGIVVVGVAGTSVHVREAINAGADAFLPDSSVEEALALVVRAVAAGQLSVPRDLRRCAVPPSFSYREKQVLALVMKGFQNREIADRLFIAESTVKTHLGAAFEKLGVRSRKEAANILMDPDEGLRPLFADVLDELARQGAVAH